MGKREGEGQGEGRKGDVGERRDVRKKGGEREKRKRKRGIATK